MTQQGEGGKKRKRRIEAAPCDVKEVAGEIGFE